MIEDSKLSPFGAEMVAGLSDFCDALESGEPIEERFAVHKIRSDGEIVADPNLWKRRIRESVETGPAETPGA